jgi:hypothetical protein
VDSTFTPPPPDASIAVYFYTGIALIYNIQCTGSSGTLIKLEHSNFKTSYNTFHIKVIQTSTSTFNSCIYCCINQTAVEIQSTSGKTPNFDLGAEINYLKIHLTIRQFSKILKQIISE